MIISIAIEYEQRKINFFLWEDGRREIDKIDHDGSR